MRYAVVIMPNGISDAERIQAEHYNRIAHDYAVHYGDFYSRKYRDLFIHGKLFQGIDLRGRNVLEAMCGSGETTAYLLNCNAHVTGIDVSQSEIAKFETRWPNARGLCTSILNTELDDDTFDCVAVIGGLHHLHPHLNEGIEELHRILKPGGYLCFAEPHAASIVDSMRRLWYRHDDLFASNEAAIDVTGLRNEFSDRFRVDREHYSGNLAYLLVLNSMVFRIPGWLKRIYSPALLKAESMIERLQGPALSCMVLARWQKL